MPRFRLPVLVRRKAFERTYRHGFKLLSQQARLLAEQFVLAHAAADSREGAFLADLLVGGFKIPLRHQADEALDVDVQRAGLHANGIFALQTTQRLNADLIHGEPQRDLGGALHAVFRCPHRQHLARRLGIAASAWVCAFTGSASACLGVCESTVFPLRPPWHCVLIPSERASAARNAFADNNFQPQ